MKKKTTYILFSHSREKQHTNASEQSLERLEQSLETPVQSLMLHRQAGAEHPNSSHWNWVTVPLLETETTPANSLGPANITVPTGT